MHIPLPPSAIAVALVWYAGMADLAADSPVSRPRRGGSGGHALTGGNRGDSGLTRRAELLAIEQAARNGWPIDPEVRRLAVEQAAHDMVNGETTRDRMIAVRALAALDAINARRELNSITARQGDIRAQAAAVRALSEAPEMRQLLAQLSAEYARQAPPVDETAASLPADGASPPTGQNP